MKASPFLIELLTHGQIDYVKIGNVLHVSSSTARKICNGKRICNDTALKIRDVFPYATLRQLFRRPFKHLEIWQRLLQDELTKGSGELSLEARKRISHKYWKLTHPQHVKAQGKRYRRKKARIQCQQSGNSSSITQQLESYDLMPMEAA